MPIYSTYELSMRSVFGAVPFNPAAENYGEEKTIRKDEIGKMDIVSVGKSRYFIPDGSAWTAGAGQIRLDRAYRVFSESGDKLVVREIIRQEELINPAMGLMSELERILERNRQQRLKGDSK